MLNTYNLKHILSHFIDMNGNKKNRKRLCLLMNENWMIVKRCKLGSRKKCHDAYERKDNVIALTQNYDLLHAFLSLWFFMREVRSKDDLIVPFTKIRVHIKYLIVSMPIDNMLNISKSFETDLFYFLPDWGNFFVFGLLYTHIWAPLI